jgi:hypothetical protein
MDSKMRQEGEVVSGVEVRPTRWSYSSLTTYEECPAKWKYSYVDKLFSPPSPAMERGTRLHSQCEEVLTDHNVSIPVELSNIATILDRLRINNAASEKAWRLDSNWKPVEAGSWLIGIVDVHFVKDGALHVYDFKSGKPYANHKKQLELYALIGLSTLSNVDRVECGAIYIDTGKIGYQRTIPIAEAKTMKESWSSRAALLFNDLDLTAKRGSGCFWCTYKDSLGGPCRAWRQS